MSVSAAVGPIAVRQSASMALSTYANQPYQVTLPGVLAHSLIYVVTAWPNDSGTTFPFSNWTVYDNVGGSGSLYTKIGQVDDTVPADSESYAHWYMPNVTGNGDYTISFYDTLVFESGRLQYIGVSVYEIINAASASPLVGHAELGPTSVSGSATDAITGSVSSSAQPSLIIASCGSNAGTAPSAAPASGTGFTDEGAQWDFIGNGTSRWIRTESKRVTATGSQGLTFTPTGTDVYMTVAAAFKEGT